MKRILTLLVAFFAVATLSYAQSDFSLWGGYSWVNGVVGAEYQYNKFGVSAGYYPAKMPGSGDRVSSFSAAFTFYGKDNEYLDNHSGALGACYYATIGFASAGYRSQVSYNGGSWTDDVVSPMTIAMVGVKSYASKWQFKLGCGMGWCEYATAFTWEIGFGYALFSSHSW